jgi:hypothetical protein
MSRSSQRSTKLILIFIFLISFGQATAGRFVMPALCGSFSQERRESFMSPRLLKILRTGALVSLAVAVSTFASAKPPDLPATTREVVAPETDHPRIEIVQDGWGDKPDGLEVLGVVPVEVEAIPVQPSELPPDANNETAAPEAVEAGVVDPQRGAARQIYLIGERCRRQGDVDMATNCYQEARLLCPESDYARKAGRRLRELKAASGNSQPDQGTFLQTPLLGVDPQIVRDLEDVLIRSVNFQTPKVVIELTEPPVQAEPSEEQEVPPMPAIPNVIVPLPPPNLTIHIDEPETYGATSARPPRAGTEQQTSAGFEFDFEIATGRSGSGLRGEGSVVVGPFGYKVSYDDNDGYYTLVVKPFRP